MTTVETNAVCMNVMWVTAQVLGPADPNFDEYEFAETCGVRTKTDSGRPGSGISAGLRKTTDDRYYRPGTWDVPTG